MSYFDKEFVLERQENFDGFLNSLGDIVVPENIKQALLTQKTSTKLSKNGDKYTLVSIYPNGPHEATFSLGVEYEETLFGNTAKVTTTLEGNTFISVQKFDQTTVTYKREFSDKQMVLTIISSTWNGVAKRVYKAA